MSLLLIPGIPTVEEPVIPNKNSRRYKQLLEQSFDEQAYLETQLCWDLDRFQGILENPMEFYPILPKEMLPNSLTAAQVIAQLNTASCFDWEYEPQDGDYLKLRLEYIAKPIAGKDRPPLWDYMAFIYQNGRWDNGFYDYDADLVHLESGVVLVSE